MDDFILNKFSDELLELIKENENINKEDIQNFIVEKYNFKPREAIHDRDDLQQKIDMFIEGKRFIGVTESTLVNYKGLLKKLALFTDKRVEDITVFDLRRFLSEVTKDKQKHRKKK